MMTQRVAPDLVGVCGFCGVCALAQRAQVLVCVADGANAPSGGTSGAARLKVGRVAMVERIS